VVITGEMELPVVITGEMELPVIGLMMDGVPVMIKQIRLNLEC